MWPQLDQWPGPSTGAVPLLHPDSSSKASSPPPHCLRPPVSMPVSRLGFLSVQGARGWIFSGVGLHGSASPEGPRVNQTSPVSCPPPPNPGPSTRWQPPSPGEPAESSRGPQPGKAAGEPKRRTWQPSRSARPPPWILLFLKSPQFKERLLPPSRGPPRGLAGGVAHWPACLFSPSASLAARQ